MLFNLVNNSGVTDNAGINWDYSNPDSINTLTNMIIIINNLSLVGAISEQQSVNFSFQICMTFICLMLSFWLVTL